MSLIPFFLQLQNNIKLYHWMTTSYARHKASDSLFDEIVSLSDKFIEIYIGKYGRQNISKKDSIIQLQTLNDQSILEYLDQAIKFLLSDLVKSLKKEDVDLLNLRDEIVAALNQTKYLFTLQ